MATTNKSFRVKSGLTVEGGALYPAAGTTSIAPIVLTSGTNLTSATAGAFEYDGTSFYLTAASGGRKTISFTDHVHGNISATGKIGSTSGLVVVTGASGVLTALTAGTSGQFLRYDGTWAAPTGATYSQSAVTTTGGAFLRLTGSDASTDDVKFASGTNTTVAYTDADTITISSTDTNYYPTTFAWTAGTTAGPTGSLTGSGMSAVSYASIPVAAVGASGVVTTGAQEFAGVKTLTSPSITTSLTTTSTSFDLVNTAATTVNIAGAGTAVAIGASTGNTTVNNNLVVTGNLTVNGTTNTINSTTITVDDKNIELGSVTTPTNTTADGGGITLKGATDKTFNWVNATSAWTSSEHLDLASGKALYIAGTSVLNATTLGSAVVNSSLTKVGALSGGTAGFVKADASGNLTTDSNTYIATSSNYTLVSGSGSTTGTTALTLSSIYNFGGFNGGEFIVKATNGSNVEITKVLVITDGTNVYLTNYGDVYISSSLVTVDFTYSAPNVNMVITPVAGTTGTTSVKVTGTLLAA